MKTALIMLLLFTSIMGFAQDKVPELITDRPDQTESSSVVPHQSLQIETGFVMENSTMELSKQRSFAYNSTLLRYGLLQNFELRLGLEYLGDTREMSSPDITSKMSGLSPLYAGFKIKIAEEDGWKPEIAFLGSLVLPFTANEDYKPDHPAASMRFAFAHTLSNRFSLGYNLGIELDGESPVPGYYYSIVLGIGITDHLGMFLESYGLIPEDGNAEHLLDTGFSYLLLPNLQFDISGGLGINENAINNFISTGLSIRLPH